MALTPTVLRTDRNDQAAHLHEIFPIHEAAEMGYRSGNPEAQLIDAPPAPVFRI